MCTHINLVGRGFLIVHGEGSFHEYINLVGRGILIVHGEGIFHEGSPHMLSFYL
jgi:hypothetical protein